VREEEEAKRVREEEAAKRVREEDIWPNKDPLLHDLVRRAAVKRDQWLAITQARTRNRLEFLGAFDHRFGPSEWHTFEMVERTQNGRGVWRGVPGGRAGGSYLFCSAAGWWVIAAMESTDWAMLRTAAAAAAAAGIVVNKGPAVLTPDIADALEGKIRALQAKTWRDLDHRPHRTGDLD
jgi:hypothetical protein